MPTRSLSCILLSLAALCAVAQSPSQLATSIPAAEAIDHVLEHNVLTYHGTPFHAVMDISNDVGDARYQGRVEVIWAADQKYVLHLSSRDFDQTLVVNGQLVKEQDRGDFFPGWLREFATALLDPVSRQSSMRNGSPLTIGTPYMPCLKHDDRPGGITDQLTWANICFSADGKTLEFVDDFTFNMEFHDFKSFSDKSIARSYICEEGDRVRIHGRLDTLEPIRSVNESLFDLDHSTPLSERILTTFVSTRKEESMLESAPRYIAWPPVREGKREGYMIVHAITDRTGQVRETSKHNSDNAGLESFGREVALQYKFHPLIIDGAPQQMEMPLVLHFTAPAGDPIPELDDKTSRSLITGCSLPRKIKDPASAGRSVSIQFQVSDDGHLMTVRSSDKEISVMTLFQQFRACHFGLYRQHGEPTAYHANVSMTAE